MLRDPKAEGKQLAFTVVVRCKELGNAIRTARWRYTRWPSDEELYDLQSDPEEETNLANEEKHSDTIKECEPICLKWRHWPRRESDSASGDFYFLQHPVLQLLASVAMVAAVALTEQQPAPQDFAPSAQQSHLQFSHEQTPKSQQHPPSGQQLSQKQTFESVVDFEVLAKFAPIAIPIPTKNNKTNVAANFILTSLIYCLRTTICIEAFELPAFSMLLEATNFTRVANYFSPLVWLIFG